ncbi:transaldolase [Alkalispirochaeta americana]|uniref:Transaldolase n=1 Tax=Alkalispirochaeta americana TaxID=159291 RepID=A0A1N6R8I5_9SPIO|nr:transaldolase family protein [Alkalispirochaeta americana]SIQ25127.1 transaldolase [Alkalispirochaeta americana]
MSAYQSPLHEMSQTTPTDYWNDSSATDELEYGIQHGAVGATTNPVIVVDVLKKSFSDWEGRIREIIGELPTATEDDIAWKLIDEMAIKAAKLLEPVFEKTGGKKGRLSMQTNAKFYRDAEAMVKQSLHFAQVIPNLNVKMPVTEAGVKAIEEVTYHGISVNATVSFTVPQALAVAEAVERGLKRREAEGLDNSKMAPVCTIMVGRTDDWMKVVTNRENIIVNPDYLEWAGVAVFKNAYRIYQEKGYTTRLLAAAYRNHYHWSQFIGGDVVLTIPCKWAKRFNGSDVTVEERMSKPVDPAIIKELSSKIEDFRRAYEPDGMTPAEFDTYGANVRTLRQFIGGYAELCQIIRDLMIPNPDK